MIWLSIFYAAFGAWMVLDTYRSKKKWRELDAEYEQLIEAMRQERARLADLYYWRH